MSLIPHSIFDMDSWTQPSIFQSPFQSFSILDAFDPFEEMDRMMSPNLLWINQPSSFEQQRQQPLNAPQRHRITIDCQGFQPESIKTEMCEGKEGQQSLIVSASEEVSHEGEDYTRRSFKKTFLLPKNAQHEKLVSFMAPSGELIVEVPLAPAIATESAPAASFLPQIVDAPDGGKTVQLQLQIPENVDPDKIQVSLKGRDVIVKIEDKVETPNSYSRVHIYNKSRLPENTDLNGLRCIHHNNVLRICAPLDLAAGGKGKSSGRVGMVPIEKSLQHPTIQPQKSEK